MKILLKLSYLGTSFCGYQVQGDKRSIQGELTRAAGELFSYDCDITGCSRTDSGVHANMFCATVSKKGESGLATTLEPEKIVRALNAHLPDDICIYSAEWVEDGFHPRYDVRFKEYVYRIYNGDARIPFENRRRHILKKKFTSEQIEKMKLAAAHLTGKRDYSAFMAQGSCVASTVRDVKYAEVETHGDIIEFKVAADGFLYNMVRIMAGTLIAVGEGKISPDAIDDIVATCDRSLAGQTAPACGLYLNKVVY